MASRRTFLETSALAAGATALGSASLGAAEAPMIGIQVGAVSFVDEGTEKVIDGLREMAAVNTLSRTPSCTEGRASSPRRPPTIPATTSSPT